jgi:hypothetical protein
MRQKCTKLRRLGFGLGLWLGSSLSLSPLSSSSLTLPSTIISTLIITLLNSHYVEARAKLLPLAQTFARLEKSTQEKYVHSGSCHSFGWSHGKEKLQGRPDLSKGSYYANPQYDRPVDDDEIIAQYPSFVHPNIWPKDDLPELEPAFKELGKMIISVGLLVAKQCDLFVHSQSCTYREDNLQSVILESKCCKARLLHYFPMENNENATVADDEFSSWCGW